MNTLHSLIEEILESPDPIRPKSIFGLGEGLKAYAENESKHGGGRPKIWQSTLNVAQQYKTQPSFLHGVLVSMGTDEFSFDACLDGFIDQMIDNLNTSSHLLRQLSLRIIITAYTKAYGHESEILATALAIESLPLDLKSARTISMHVRKLASLYKGDDLHHWIRKAIPHFCFGIQTYKLSSIRSDAIEVLKQICEESHGEEIVSDLAFQSLEAPGCRDESLETAAEQPHKRVMDEFECSNLSDVDRGFHDCVTGLEHPEGKIIERFWDNHNILHGTASSGPSSALRVLLGIPKVAEKKSRRLVPVFLRWAVVDKSEFPPQTGTQDGNVEIPKLSGQDRKVMLNLFGLFNNPRVLYRSSDVFEALQSLLANGDVEIQKSALNAVLTWKNEAIQPYRESLLNLLDDSRFRDEITTFLHPDDQDSKIQEEHRPQLMPILLRLLYGKLISRTGNHHAKRTQGVKRKVILETLARFDDTEIQEFLNIAIGPIDGSFGSGFEGHDMEVTSKDQLSPRKQLGLLYMIRDLLNTLGTRLKPFTGRLARAAVLPAVESCRVLGSEKTDSDDQESAQTSLLKNIRQTALQCINILFQHCPAKIIKPYIPTLFAEIINPRLDSLPIDTAQSVSGLLQLFSTWASSRQSASFLVAYNTGLLETISQCLDIEFAKDGVKIFVLEEILKPLIGMGELESAFEHDADSLQIAEHVLRPNINAFLVNLGGLLRKSPSKELLASTIDCVTRLAPFVRESSQTRNILELASFLLNQPSPRVSPRTKGDLLQILQHLLPQHNFLETPHLQDMIFTTVSSLFGYFKDRSNRLTLVQVLLRLAEKENTLQRVADLCRSLNSYSAIKVDEPDFDTRLQAFNAINEHEYDKLGPKQWRPILFNMLFFIRDTEELAIRSSASFTLRRFVEANPINIANGGPNSSDLVQNVLLPALRKGASETSELVKTEYLAIMADLVRSNSKWHEVSDMGVLLVADDEEASFFNNILHIQQHRRLRALRRLATEARQNRLQSKNIAHFFLPLIEHFVFNKAEDESAHNLSSETVTTIGALALSMEWPQFRAVFRRYLGYIENKPDLAKTMIRLVGVLANSLSSTALDERETPLTSNEEDPAITTQRHTTLAKSLPGQQKLAQDLTGTLLPALTKYLHEKEESTVSLRVPVAVSAVKLLKMSAPGDFADRLPPILTDVCNILRSRAQESRDLTRKTLADIAVVAGPAYFGFILKELRRALTRGYQLHVLSYTVHSILIATAAVFKHGDLDYCLSQIVAVIMDDTFGATGQEKDAEEYISKMKEVKSSKSYDSMEIVAKSATAENYLELIRPLQSLLDERLDLKAGRKIDELLRRIALGLLHNETIESRQVLIFCHEIIREAYKSGNEGSNGASRQDSRNKRFLINVAGAPKSQRGSASSSSYKLVRFAFDLLRSVLHRYDSLQTPANLSGFMPMLGDAMVQPNEEIRMSAIRLLTTIIKVPLHEIDNNAAIYVTESVGIVKASPATNSELAQAALKLVSAILRERRDVEVREIDLAYLLKRIQPDLEELDRQGVAFNLLKAVMNRKIVIVEVYEVLEAIASMMITNQTRSARDQARSVYFDFLVNYPQGKGRFSKQLAFLVKNLEYKHPEGRQSVMEAIHLLLSKISADLLQSILETFFVPLVMIVVNDESPSCREMAGALLRIVLEKSDTERNETFLALLRSWLSQLKQPLLVRVALQVYGIFFDVQKGGAERELPFLLGQLAKVLQSNLMSTDDTDWELLYYALQTFIKISQIHSSASFSASTAAIWTCIRQCISFPHVWVKLSAAKLQGVFFADIARTNAGNDEPELPLKGSGGLQLSGLEMEQTTRASLALLKVSMLSEELATQVVRNLVFLAKMMNSTSWIWGDTDATKELFSGEEGTASENVPSETDVESHTQSGLAFIMQRASIILRHGPATTREPSLIPAKAAMQLIWTLCSSLSLEAVRPSIRTVLLPLHNLTDPSVPPPFSNDEGFVNGYKALVSHGAEIMAMLQKKFGTSEYIMHLSQVREGIKERRNDRRVKRRIEAVADPEKTGRLKRRKGEKKKEKRKEKSAGQRSMRRGW